ncbi:hypothetical protein AB0C29_43570, partial [Actinoplanes sp. NPDC048791]|uniref:hypothetical protein n=1 Tax=Actinoplanes sp. NPDC048791 TaxID=3154623 RepID=UPI0033ED2DDF
MHRRNPRPWRRADPLVVVLLVLAVTAVVGFGARRTGTGPQVAMFWLLMAAVHGCFAVLSAQVARAGPAVARRLWLSFSLAGAAFLVGDVAQLVAVARAPLAPAALDGPDFQIGAVDHR